MDPRSTLVERIFSGAWRVKSGIVAKAATTPTASQVRPWREAGRPFELWLVPANYLSFRLRRGQLQALIYHCGGRERTLRSPRRCMVRCGRGLPDAEEGMGGVLLTDSHVEFASKTVRLGECVRG